MVKDHHNIIKFKGDILDYIGIDWSKLIRNSEGSLEWLEEND